MSARANFLIFTLGLSVTLLSCGQESDEDGEPNAGVPVGATEAGASPTPSEPGDEPASCFTDAECDEGRYCEASDPSSSPEGRCAPLALEGAACQFGTQCAGALVCVKPRGGGQGDCQPAPSGCEPLRCDCALTLCAQLEGSSCSAGDLDDPESSLTVSCAP